MKIIVSHPTSNQNNRAVIDGFYEAEMLHEFHTSIAMFPESFLNSLSGFKPFKEFQRRSFDSKLKNFTKSYPTREMIRLLALKLKMSTHL